MDNNIRTSIKDYYGTRNLTESDILKMLTDYYDERGWDLVTGNPSKEGLEELGVVIDG